MQRIMAVLTALVTVAGSTLLQAQQKSRLELALGAGVNNPTGDFRSGFKTGWNGMGMVGYSLSAPLEVRVDGMYAQDGVKGPITGKSKLFGGSADVAYDFRAAKPASFYLLGGLGAYNVKPEVSGITSSSETKFAWNGGAGAKLNVGMAHLFLESRYVSVSTTGGKTNFIPVTAGLSFAMR